MQRPRRLPFDHLQVWTKVEPQNRSYHTPHHILPHQTNNALPIAASKVSHLLICPSHPTDFPTWFQGTISRSCVLFFVPSHPEEPQILLVPIYFSCAQRFSTVPEFPPTGLGQSNEGPYPEPSTGMHLLKRACQADGPIMGISYR